MHRAASQLVDSPENLLLPVTYQMEHTKWISSAVSLYRAQTTGFTLVAFLYLMLLFSAAYVDILSPNNTGEESLPAQPLDARHAVPPGGVTGAPSTVPPFAGTGPLRGLPFEACACDEFAMPVRPSPQSVVDSARSTFVLTLCRLLASGGSREEGWQAGNAQRW
jgi:hypothetical protein